MIRKFLCRLLGCPQVIVTVKHADDAETIRKIEAMLAEERNEFFTRWMQAKKSHDDRIQ